MHKLLAFAILAVLLTSPAQAQVRVRWDPHYSSSSSCIFGCDSQLNRLMDQNGLMVANLSARALHPIQIGGSSWFSTSVEPYTYGYYRWDPRPDRCAKNILKAYKGEKVTPPTPEQIGAMCSGRPVPSSPTPVPLAATPMPVPQSPVIVVTPAATPTPTPQNPETVMVINRTRPGECIKMNGREFAYQDGMQINVREGLSVATKTTSTCKVSTQWAGPAHDILYVVCVP